jgi:hypothetical protein
VQLLARGSVTDTVDTMTSENIGVYEHTETGRRHTVMRRTLSVSSRPVSGSGREHAGSIDYITADGIDLNPLDDDEYEFEMIQVDGILRRV